MLIGWDAIEDAARVRAPASGVTSPARRRFKNTLLASACDVGTVPYALGQPQCGLPPYRLFPSDAAEWLQATADVRRFNRPNKHAPLRTANPIQPELPTIKALVYRGPGKKAVEDRPKPVIDAATDAIVKISKTTICGTDLHILKGNVATCRPGRVLGHEGTGIIDEVGRA
jgi:hypothetical protein